jgi:hypothetical protein
MSNPWLLYLSSIILFERVTKVCLYNTDSEGFGPIGKVGPTGFRKSGKALGLLSFSRPTNSQFSSVFCLDIRCHHHWTIIIVLSCKIQRYIIFTCTLHSSFSFTLCCSLSILREGYLVSSLSLYKNFDLAY